MKKRAEDIVALDLQGLDYCDRLFCHCQLDEQSSAGCSR